MTFRLRTTLALCALSLSVLATAGGFYYVSSRSALEGNLDDALKSIAMAELASALDGPNGQVHVHDEQPIPLLLEEGVGYRKFALILSAEGKVVAKTGNLASLGDLDPDPDRVLAAIQGRASIADLSSADGQLRAIYSPLRGLNGRPLASVCAIPKAPMLLALSRLERMLGAVLLAGALLLAAASTLLAKRLTLPVERIADAAKSVNDRNLGARVPELSKDRELAEVTGVLNDMLERLQGAFADREAVIDAQRRFLQDASHELRSPLTNLRGTLEVVLRRDRDPAEYRSAIRLALRESVRLSRLVDDLLTLSRADSGTLGLDEEACSAAEIAAETAACFQARGQELRTSIELVSEPPDSSQVVLIADPGRVRQALDNLVDNALRHTPPGGRVEIRTRVSEGQAVFEVRDTGAGFAPDQREMLFDRFYRADRSRSRDTGGLGLGLSIVKAIAEAHGGSAEAESLPDGSLFRIRLPLGRLLASRGAAAQPTSGDGPASEPVAASGAPRILSSNRV